jgi:hypothetical protein
LISIGRPDVFAGAPDVAFPEGIGRQGVAGQRAAK